MQDDPWQHGNTGKRKPRLGNARKSSAAQSRAGNISRPAFDSVSADGQAMPDASASDGTPALPVSGGGPAPFWTTKQLGQMSGDEWESLCDGCGRCCLLKLEDADTSEIYHTRLACRLLNLGSCRCSNYQNRHAEVPDCVVLDVGKINQLSWLPATCAYRLISEGKALAWWHPLVSGSAETVHQAGISARGYARSEDGVRVEDLLDYIVDPDD